MRRVLGLTAVLLASLFAGCSPVGRPQTLPQPEATRTREVSATAEIFTATAAPGVEEQLPQPVEGSLNLYFLDVGQGDGTLIVCPNGNRHLIDLGTSSPPDIADPAAIRQTLRSLLDPNSPTLTTLVVIHPDGDHYNLLASALGNPQPVKIEAAYVSGQPNEFDSGSNSGFRDLYQTLLDEGIAESFSKNEHDSMHQPSDRFDCGEDVFFWLLASEVPEPTTRSNFIKNTRSAVILVSYGDFDAILTGDGTYTTEDFILSRYPAAWLDSELLKLGHHGSSATSTSSTWAKSVSPEIAVASSGFHPEGNSYGHPNNKVIARIAKQTDQDTATHELYSCDGMKDCLMRKTKEWIYTTASSGTILVTTDGASYSISCTRQGGC